MSVRSRNLLIVAGIFPLAVLGWNAFAWHKESRLSEMAAPFFAACQTDAGCLRSPDGWKPDGTGGYYQGLYEYRATSERFALRQHLATDVWLVAEGGKGSPVRTRRDVE